MTLTPIFYFYVLGESESQFSFLLPEKRLAVCPIMQLGHLPQTLEHYANPDDYFVQARMMAYPHGYMVNFLRFNDIGEPFFKVTKELSEGCPVVFILNEDGYSNQAAVDLLKPLSGVGTAFLINNGSIPTGVQNIFDDWTLLAPFFDTLIAAEGLTKVESQHKIEVPVSTFRATHANTLLLNTAFGKWDTTCFFDSLTAEEQQRFCEEERQRVESSDEDVRQNVIAEQLEMWHSFDKRIHDAYPNFPQEIINSPLILCLPFTSNGEAEQFLDNTEMPEEFKNLTKPFSKIMKSGQTLRYTMWHKATTELEAAMVRMIIAMYQAPRNQFQDNVGFLHASLRFSPYVRLPLCARSMYERLSYVRTANQTNIMKPQTLAKNFNNIGKEMAKLTLTKRLAKDIGEYPRQVVAVSDLPVEWLQIDGVPLAFTHDVCRIPEKPANGVLGFYTKTNMFKHHATIGRDIIQKTLVVFGNREPAFEAMHTAAFELQKQLGFKIAYCDNKQQFIDAVQRERPQLLIVDSHGGTDLDRKESYLMMGSDRVYPEDIAYNDLAVPLVFLSACNTAPAYDDVSPIANAFFEIGSLCVTSAYVPLEVFHGTTMYLRLLQQLHYACRHRIHPNWLSFVSHILRFSFIQSPLTEETSMTRLSPEDRVKRADLLGHIGAFAMIFENRRRLYQDLFSKRNVLGVYFDYSKYTPHYLCYSTLGRADLILFESAVDPNTPVSNNKIVEDYLRYRERLMQQA